MPQHETHLEKRARMFTLIETYRSSTQTQKAFCLEHDIKYSTFQFWLKQYRLNHNSAETHEKRLGSNGFMPIKISSGSSRSHSGFQIEYPSGIRIQMDRIPDVGLIRELLNVQVV